MVIREQQVLQIVASWGRRDNDASLASSRTGCSRSTSSRRLRRVTANGGRGAEVAVEVKVAVAEVVEGAVAVAAAAGGGGGGGRSPSGSLSQAISEPSLLPLKG